MDGKKTNNMDMKGHVSNFFFIWVGRKKVQGNWAWKNISTNGINRQISFFFVIWISFHFQRVIKL
jgi:hypothetical protein